MVVVSNNSTMSPSGTKRRRVSTRTPAKRRRISSCNLGFPQPYLYYLKKNASPKLLFKLMQTSKYFCYNELPFLVVKDIYYSDGKWHYIHEEKNGKTYLELNLENAMKLLWIASALRCMESDNTKLVSQLLPKIAICDLNVLHLENQILTLNEFKALTSFSKIVDCRFYYSHVENEDGSVTSVDEIVKLLPKVERIEWYINDKVASTITSLTSRRLIKNLNPSILNEFYLNGIPEKFGFKLFAAFMDKNPFIKFNLDFRGDISKRYSKMLQNYVQKLLETSLSQQCLIFICFAQQNRRSLEPLNDRIYNFG